MPTGDGIFSGQIRYFYINISPVQCFTLSQSEPFIPHLRVEARAISLRDAVNETMRAWVVDLSTTHYIIGSTIEPHPSPTIVRTFQSVIGNETKEQIQTQMNKLPDTVVACVDGGSNASGMFSPFEKTQASSFLVWKPETTIWI